MTQLAPQPKFQVCAVDGTPLVGGRLYTFVAGTSTPKDTYTTYSRAASNTNPVILDSRGEASVWLDGAYRFTLKDADDVLIWDVDEIRDLTSALTLTGATLAGPLTVSSTAITWSGNPTHSGNHAFTNNVAFNGNVIVGDSISDTLTVLPNAVTWGASTTHSGAHTFSGNAIFGGNVTISGNLSASNLNLPTYGTYTPTYTSVTNASGGSSALCNWTRIGSVVTVSGTVVLGASGSGNTVIALSIPVVSAFTTGLEIGGSGATTTRIPLYLSADAVNDRLTIEYTAAGAGPVGASFTFTYGVA